MSQIAQAQILSVQAATSFVAAILTHNGLNTAHSNIVARKLIESDLFGHRTHGMAKLGQYVRMLKSGDMGGDGEIVVTADHGASFAWSAHRLPGALVLSQCLDEMLTRIASQPVVTATIANCSHIGCLQTYLEPIARKGYIGLLMASDPGVATVAPFGGVDPVLGPNPFAMCIPTSGDPILIDQCTSTVSNSEVNIAAAAGQPLRGMWLMDGEGRPTSDPSVFSSNPKGSIMPLGGFELGHKGFGFGLMVEALALALSGYGRSQPSKRAGGQGVFVQLINPEFFSGAAMFGHQIDGLTNGIKASRPVPGTSGTRLPGHRAQAERRRQEMAGIEIDPALLAQLQQLAKDAGVELLCVEPA
jgi:LDH2 family malate/lactate/ureidoglycolate dehydrogenase